MNILKRLLKKICLVIVFAMLASMIPLGGITFATTGFSDLPSDHWAFPYVNELVDKGIVQGVGGGRYGTDDNLTRAEFCTFIVRAMAKDTGEFRGTFSDVAMGQWYTPFVEAAAANGFMNGKGNGIFDPNGNITRQEMALTMANVISKQRMTTAHDISNGYTLTLKDAWQVDTWAIYGVRSIIKFGIMSGDYSGFRPLDSTTRAETAKVISGLLKELSADLDTTKPTPTTTPVVTPPDEYGNTSGNTMNCGLSKQEGDTIYFADPIGYLCRMNSTGLEVTRICDDIVGRINVIDNVIYYKNYSDNRSIYRIDTNGNNRTKLCNSEVSYINVYNNNIYYINLSDNSFYKMGLNGDNNTKIVTQGSPKYAIIYDGWIYFSITQPNGEMKKIKTDGTQEQGIFNILVSDFMIYDNVLYYTDSANEYSLKSINLDDSLKTTISSDDVGSFNISSGWIYYANYTEYGNLYKMQINGANKTKLNMNEVWLLNIVDNWICYFSPTDNLVYMIDQNGNGDRLIDGADFDKYITFYQDCPSVPTLSNVNFVNYNDIYMENGNVGYIYNNNDISDSDIGRYGILLMEHGFDYEQDTSQELSTKYGYRINVFSSQNYIVMFTRTDEDFEIQVYPNQ